MSTNDALFLVGSKGTVAGVVNTGIALALGAHLPWAFDVGAAMVVGLLSYGISLVLFVLALSGVGAARTGAYFSTAPFFGAAIAILAFGDHASPMFWLAAMLMGAGVWMHLTEPRAQWHTAAALTHTHPPVRDGDHQHMHDFPWDGTEPHTHEHMHAPIDQDDPRRPNTHRPGGHA